MIDVEFMKLFWPIAAIHPGPKGTWLSAAGSKSQSGKKERIGLDWIGLDWIGLDWIGLDWIGLDW